MDNQNDIHNDNQNDNQTELDIINEKLIILQREINEEESMRDGFWVSSTQRKLEKEYDEWYHKKKELESKNENSNFDIQTEIDFIDKKLRILLRDINEEDAMRDSHLVRSKQRRLEKEYDECYRRKKELLSKIKK